MKKSAHVFRAFALLLLIHLVLPHRLLGQAPGSTVYVWLFANRDGSVDEITANLTREFEEALINSQRYTVLQRRNHTKILEQIQNEKAIIKKSDLSNTAINYLKTLEATFIAFGEVYNNSQSGLIEISVSFETFESTIPAMATTYIPIYERDNPFRRREKIQELIADLTKDQEKIVPSRAHFTYESEGLTVHFKDSSIVGGTIAKWSWKFGDPAGSVSSEKNPSFTFPEEGNYTVILDIETDDGQYSSADRLIYVAASRPGRATEDSTIKVDRHLPSPDSSIIDHDIINNVEKVKLIHILIPGSHQVRNGRGQRGAKLITASALTLGAGLLTSGIAVMHKARTNEARKNYWSTQTANENQLGFITINDSYQEWQTALENAQNSKKWSRPILIGSIVSAVAIIGLNVIDISTRNNPKTSLSFSKDKEKRSEASPLLNVVPGYDSYGITLTIGI